MAVWAAVIGIVGWSVARRRKIAKVVRQNDEAVGQLAAGELEAAGQSFDVLCGQSRGAPALHSLIVYNRAWVYLGAGDADRAAALLTAVLHAGWLGRHGTLAPHYATALGRLALAEALRGRLDVAQSWRTRAHEACSPAKRGQLLIVDMTLECMNADYERALELVEETWTKAENVLTARQLRAARLLEAFALERLKSDDYRGVSRSGDFVRALEAARPRGENEFTFLTAHWDEVAEFVTRHDLGGR